MRILVVDDTDAVLLLITRFVQALGHEAIQARNGQEAIIAWRRDHPDLLLMDVMMPVMTGPEAAEVIKQEAGENWVPIVFVTSMGEETALAEAIERCADDYLGKPVNFRVLEAKLKVFARTLELTRKVREQSLKLGDYYDRTEEEKRVVRHLMDQMVNAERLSDASLQYWLSPAESLSGDLIASARTPGRVLHVLLADGIGHGITAALNVLPLTQPFYSMTDKGYSITDILQEMNSKVRQVLPVGRFVAVALIAIDEVSRCVEVWNGGMPPVQILSEHGQVLQVCKSTNLPLGILPNVRMDFAAHRFVFDAPGIVLAHSDGLTEAQCGDGQVFGAKRILDVAQQEPASQWLPALQKMFSDFLNGKPHHDDVSLILAAYSPAAQIEAQHPSEAGILDRMLKNDALEWVYRLRLGADELRAFKAVPFVMTFVNGIQNLRHSRADVYRLLSELFTAALEQGALGLPVLTDDSVQIKEARRVELAARLATLSTEWVELQVVLEWIDGRKALLLRTSWSANPVVQSMGLPLAHALCAEVRHNSVSNEVLACYLPE